MSDLPADTLTTTIAEVIDEWWATSEQPTIVHDGVTYIASLDLAAAVVSVLATHNQHTAADAWERGRSDRHDANCRLNGEPDDCICANPYRLAAVSPTPPTHNATESPWNTHDTLTDAQQQEWWRNKQADESDEPTVCVAHGSFIPCRKHGEHNYTSNPYWVKSVRDYQTSTIPNLTWEPVPPTHTTTTEDR